MICVMMIPKTRHDDKLQDAFEKRRRMIEVDAFIERAASRQEIAELRGDEMPTINWLESDLRMINATH